MGHDTLLNKSEGLNSFFKNEKWSLTRILKQKAIKDDRKSPRVGNQMIHF